MHVLHWITDLLFPARCLGCATFGTHLCSSCADGIARARWQPGLTFWAAASMSDELASKAVWHFKYRGMRSLASPLAHLIARRFSTSGSQEWFSGTPLIVPVPLHSHRRNERGYNQAELLAHELGRISAMVVVPDALARTRKTPSQVQAGSRHERLENMHGAFSVPDTELVAGHDIILVDDVCTTGATLDACVIALKSAGARDVHAIVLARG